MSYYQYTTEEIKIHNVNKQTAFAACMLKRYIQSFAGGRSGETFMLYQATLTVDDETISAEQIFCDAGKLLRPASKGKNKGKWIPLGSNLSPFYELMNGANHLERAKEITFYIAYEWKAYAYSDTNIYYWSSFFDAFNCSALRKNVQYRGIETYDYDHSMFVYRFDKDYQGEAEFSDDPSVIAGVPEWSLDGNGGVYYDGEEEHDPFRSPDTIRSVISLMKPIFDKYDIDIDDYNDGDSSVEFQGWITAQASGLNELFEDLQKLLDIAQQYHLTIGGYTNHMEYIEPGMLALIRFRIDENNRVQKEYLCI